MGSTPHTPATTDSASEVALPTRLEQTGEQRLLYRVSAQTKGRRHIEIVGKYDDEAAVAWGFYGGILTAVTGLIGLTYEGLIGFYNVWPTFLFALALVVGLLLVRFGRRSTMEERVVATVDLVDRRLELLGEAASQVDLDEVQEIVFGLSRYPLSGDRGAVKVQAASVLVRIGDDRLVTVVNACTDKDATYGVARFLSGVTGLAVKQVGVGVK